MSVVCTLGKSTDFGGRAFTTSVKWTYIMVKNFTGKNFKRNLRLGKLSIFSLKWYSPILKKVIYTRSWHCTVVKILFTFTSCQFSLYFDEKYNFYFPRVLENLKILNRAQNVNQSESFVLAHSESFEKWLKSDFISRILEIDILAKGLISYHLEAWTRWSDRLQPVIIDRYVPRTG